MLYVGFFLTQIALFKPMGLSLQDRVGVGVGDGGLRTSTQHCYALPKLS